MGSTKAAKRACGFLKQEKQERQTSTSIRSSSLVFKCQVR